MLKIDYIPIDKIKPYEKNAKLHPKEQIEQIKKSIQQFGFNDPLALWNGEIVEGHGRYLAAQELKMKELPVIYLDDLTDEQRRAYMLVHNKLTMSSGFDIDLLNEELAGIFEFDMGDFGFDIEEEDEEENQVVEDNYDKEPPKEPKAKIGDIYILGNHRVMCGDSTKAEDVAELMDGQKVELLLTDPPYGVNAVTKNKKTAGGGKTHFGGKSVFVDSIKYEKIIGDDSIETAKKSFDVAKNFSNIQIIFGGNYFTDFLPSSRCWFVWDKGASAQCTFAQCELAWVSKDGNSKLFRRLWSGLCREGDRKTEGKNRIHPTQKPVSLCGDIIKQFECDSVLDLFGGSGSTLIACEQLNKKCFMMELSPAYVDVIIDRWEKFTGKKAEKI